MFPGQGDHWSFARTDASGRVVEIAEKCRISDWATTGLYYFRHGKDFVRQAENMIDAEDRSNGKFYVAPVYNRMIVDGADIRINPVETIWVLGTPEELSAFQIRRQKKTQSLMAQSFKVLHVLNGAKRGAAMSTIALIEDLKAYGIGACAVCDDRGTWP